MANKHTQYNEKTFYTLCPMYGNAGVVMPV